MMKKKKKEGDDAKKRQTDNNVAEVTRIIAVMSSKKKKKKKKKRHDREDEEELLHSLRRLQSMSVSAETLRVTKLGINVDHLLEHNSEDVQNLARSLINDWMKLLFATTDSTWGDQYIEEGEIPEEEEEEEEEEGVYLSDLLKDGGGNPIGNVDVGQEEERHCIEKKCNDDEIIKKRNISGVTKVEVAKRKLQESYKQVQDKKRLRMTKLVELKDLTKQQQQHCRDAHRRESTWQRRRRW